MLGCPLATASDTLWFTTDHNRYWRRLYFAAGLSVALHVIVVGAFGLYQLYQQTQPDMSLSVGAPDLPISVQLVTESKQAAAKVLEPEIKKESAVVNTIANSEIKTAKKVTNEKVAPEVVKKMSVAKETPRKEIQGAHETNVQAGTLQKSEHMGINETPVVTAKPRFKTQPQQPEYPAQAQRRKQQGIALVNITVEANGAISNATIAKSSGYPLLDGAAIKAVKKWELYPYVINGQPARAIAQVPIKFEIT